MMEAARTSKTLVNFYQTTRRNNLEVSHLHTRHLENLISQNMDPFPLLIFNTLYSSWHVFPGSKEYSATVPLPVAPQRCRLTPSRGSSKRPLSAPPPPPPTEHSSLNIFLERRQKWERQNDHSGRRNDNAASTATVGQSSKGRTMVTL
jgi:hypothetical protein